MSAVAGVVLTGGRSSRFGRDKAVEPVDGVAMAARVATSLRAAGCDPVVFVGGDPERLGALGVEGVEVVEDRHPGDGPLGGVITALAWAGDDVVVAGCDLPDLDPSTIRAVLDAGDGAEVDAAVAVASGRHVMLVRWNRTASDVLEQRFAIGERSLRGVFDHLRTVAVEVPSRRVADVDTPADLLARRGPDIVTS